MNLRLVIVFYATLAAFAVGQHDPNYCYVTDPIRTQINRFSSRTPYDVIRGRSVNPAVSCELKVLEA
jgi:hypothetical protein